MGRDFVFVGPSLPVEEARTLLPSATVLPPVRHGDLLALGARAGDRVLIVDGLFLQSAPVRHKEILMLLADGVVVAGSSSMGALRAAELWPFGMRGVGRIFGLYRDLVVTGDDEVAITHSSAEDGHRALSEPMVDIRLRLEAARLDAVISPAVEQELLGVVKRLPFARRSDRMMLHVAEGVVDADSLRRLRLWLQTHRFSGKSDDARLLLRMAAQDDPELRPHSAGDRPVTAAMTRHSRSWQLTFGNPDAAGVTDRDRALAVMLLHPAHVRRHRADVLSGLVGLPADDPGLEDAALACAAERGLTLGSGEQDDSWVSAAERIGLDHDEALITLLVRAFGTRSDQSLNRAGAGSLSQDDGVWAWAEETARAARRFNDYLPRRVGAPGRMRYRDEVVDAAFARYWGCPPDRLESAVADRGLTSLSAFRRLAEPFVAYLKLGAITPATKEAA